MSRIYGLPGTRRGLPFLAAISVAGLLLAAAPQARAGDEFEDGFKDELGRIAAYEAVGVGRGVLAQILLGGHPGYYANGPYYPTHRPRYRYDDHYDHPRYYGGHGWNHDHHRHWRGHRGHGRGHHRPRHHYYRHDHYHHRGCDH